MKCSLENLNKAAQSGLIKPEQVQALWSFLEKENHAKVSPWAMSAYYLGGALFFCAAGILTYPFINVIGASRLTLIYALSALLLTVLFARLKYFKAASLFAFITPFITYLFLNLSLEHIPLTPNENNHFDGIISAVLVVIETLGLWGAYRISLLLLPLFLFIGIFGYEIVLCTQSVFEEAYFLITYGLTTIGVAVYIDNKSTPKKDNAFWVYLLGACALSLGLFILTPKLIELYFIIYTLSNLLLLGFGVWCNRYIFYIVSALGLCSCMAHYASLLLLHVNGYLASFIFLMLGAMILWGAIKLQK